MQELHRYYAELLGKKRLPKKCDENDIRFYNKQVIYWQGAGTYYFLPSQNIWCRIQSIETLDLEVSRGTELRFIKENQVSI